MSRTNSGNSRLKGDRRRGDVMAAYDRLPGDLRAWLANAALPWSLPSARRVWRRALRRAGGNPVLAGDMLTGIEARLLQKDARVVWGRTYPTESTTGPQDESSRCDRVKGCYSFATLPQKVCHDTPAHPERHKPLS